MTHGWCTVHRSAVSPIEFLDFTSLTLDELQQLVPPFEAAFHARMTVVLLCCRYCQAPFSIFSFPRFFS
jgi:hypothetical protein